MRKLIFTLFFLFSCTLLSAQAEVVGRVVDSTDLTLPGANVVLLRTSDSLLMAFATTDDKGSFRMKEVPPNSYIMRISFLGFERPDKVITISPEDQYFDYGDLKMYPAGFFLGGVEVTADRIPIQMRGDTMMFDAEAFAVGENAVVEDLIRRLPGMSVDGAGNITYRGRPINEVMINGKPFFAGNSTLLTQNLDAKAITNVEVYDQKSDSEEITGIDDGEENMTVNLEMKEEFKAKIFGELYGGYGNEDRYQAGGKVFRISDASQLGVLGTVNNINKVGFSGDEISGFNGSSGRGRGNWWNSGGDGRLPFDDGNATGDNRSLAAGINYGMGLGKNGQLTADYALFDRTQLQRATTIEAFNRNNDRRVVETFENNATTNYSHRVGFELRQRVDSTARLRINGNLTLAGGDNTSDASTNVKNDDGSANDFTVLEQNDNMRPSGAIRINYNKGDGGSRRGRGGPGGRSFGASLSGNFSENQTDLDLLTNGIEPGLNLPGVLVNGRQVQDRRTNSRNISGGVEFAEPLSDKWRVNLEAEALHDNVQGDFSFRQAEDISTNLLERTWNGAIGSASLVYSFGKGSNVSFGTKYQGANLILEGDAMRDENYGFLLPFVRLRKRMKKGIFGANLRSNASAPSIAQLQTIADPNASGRITVGNPELDPATSYSYNSWLWYNDEFRAVSLNGSFDVA
ncbi:MAG: carboxypeptidase regulatory-like domain-containing protein, partial [Bacteroidota bacterium]